MSAPPSTYLSTAMDRVASHPPFVCSLVHDTIICLSVLASQPIVHYNKVHVATPIDRSQKKKKLSQPGRKGAIIVVGELMDSNPDRD